MESNVFSSLSDKDNQLTLSDLNENSNPKNSSSAYSFKKQSSKKEQKPAKEKSVTTETSTPSLKSSTSKKERKSGSSKKTVTIESNPPKSKTVPSETLETVTTESTQKTSAAKIPKDSLLNAISSASGPKTTVSEFLQQQSKSSIADPTLDLGDLDDIPTPKKKKESKGPRKQNVAKDYTKEIEEIRSNIKDLTPEERTTRLKKMAKLYDQKCAEQEEKLKELAEARKKAKEEDDKVIHFLEETGESGFVNKKKKEVIAVVSQSSYKVTPNDIFGLIWKRHKDKSLIVKVVARTYQLRKAEMKKKQIKIGIKRESKSSVKSKRKLLEISDDESISE